jgi:DNA-binding Lrp family transcriptional regulator
MSLKAIGLWARLLSRPDDWVFHVSEIAKSCGISEKNTYKILKELISAGYVTRDKVVDPKSKKILRWDLEVFETPQIPDKPEQKNHMDKTHQVDNHLVETGHITNTESTEIEKNDISLVPDESGTCERPPSEEKKETKAIDPEAKALADMLWKRIVAVFPKHKPPKIEEWAKILDLMHRRDNRSWEDVGRVIGFAFDDAFWVKVIQSPESLRKNFDKILAKMTPIDNSGTRYQKNRSFAQEVKAAIKTNPEKWKNFFIGDSEVVRLDTKEKVALNLEPRIFETNLLTIFKISRKD